LKSISDKQYSYLTVYEQELKRREAIADKMRQEQIKRDKEIDEKKPAFFQKNARHEDKDWRE
jgi:hypothetical protein